MRFKQGRLCLTVAKLKNHTQKGKRRKKEDSIEVGNLSLKQGPIGPQKLSSIKYIT